jgi:hypothetical protein
MPIPTNLTPATATDLSVSLTETIVAADLTLAPTQSTNYASTAVSGNPARNYKEVWFKYTTKVGERCFSVLADYTVGADYSPVLSIWTGPDVSSLSQYMIVGPSETQEFAITTGGGFGFFVPCAEETTYYFQAINDYSTTPLTAGLVMTVYEAPVEVVPANAVFINDDVDGYPAAILSPTTGEALRYIADYPAGESADWQPDGTICCQDGEADEGVRLFDPNFGLIGAISYSPRNVSGIRSDKNGHFYVVTKGSGTTQVHKITAAGVAVATWTLPVNANQSTSVAVNQTGTVFYYSRQQVAEAIHAYDLLNSVALPDFHPAIGVEYPYGFSTGNVDAAGNVYWQYATGSTGANPKLRKFDSTGALLLTQAVNTSDFSRANRMDIEPGEAAVWLWGNKTGSVLTTLQRRLVGDLSLEREIPGIVTYGVSGLWGFQYEPFGVSNSCPLVILPQSLTPPCIAPTIVSITPNQSVSPGDSVTITVVATGDAPLTYQWYIGVPGDTSSPIVGATSASYTTPALTVTTTYWVRVSNACGGADSDSSAVTVLPDTGCPVDDTFSLFPV